MKSKKYLLLILLVIIMFQKVVLELMKLYSLSEKGLIYFIMKDGIMIIVIRIVIIIIK